MDGERLWNNNKNIKDKLFFLSFLAFGVRVLDCSPGWPGIEAHPPTSATWALGLQSQRQTHLSYYFGGAHVGAQSIVCGQRAALNLLPGWGMVSQMYSCVFQPRVSCFPSHFPAGIQRLQKFAKFCPFPSRSWVQDWAQVLRPARSAVPLSPYSSSCNLFLLLFCKFRKKKISTELLRFIKCGFCRLSTWATHFGWLFQIQTFCKHRNLWWTPRPFQSLGHCLYSKLWKLLADVETWAHLFLRSRSSSLK